MERTDEEFRDRDYWIVENTQYAEPSFRLRKCAQLMNQMAGERECTLLDVGCGPAALQPLLNRNISYFGIDIALHKTASFLREVDISRVPITFDDRRFDFVFAGGVFEYMGHQQEQKFEGIRDILKDGGKFVMSYINFGHFRSRVWPNYNNVQSITAMKQSVSKVFEVERCFPASHHWRHKQPGVFACRSLQMRMNYNISILSPLFAVEYFFVCSRRRHPTSSAV